MAQLTIPLDSARFGKGMTWKDYMAQMGDTRARTEENYSKASLNEDERKFFSGINQVKYVLMLGENWCGDVHRNSPMIARIVEAMPGADLRVFLRDQNVDLTDCFLNNGYRSIPIVVFFDKDWNEVGRGDPEVVRHPLHDPRRGHRGQEGRGHGRVPQAGPGDVRRPRGQEHVARDRQRSPLGPRAAPRIGGKEISPPSRCPLPPGRERVS